MTKRRNESSQIRREDYEAQELDETMTIAEKGFEKASDDLIRQRRIVKARSMRQTTAPSSSTNAVNSSLRTNPFANFRGLVAANKSLENAQTTNSIGVTYSDEIKKLNEEFVRFIDTQRIEHPNASWEKAIQEYLEHAAAIKANCTSVEENASTRPQPNSNLMRQIGPKKEEKAIFSFGKPLDAQQPKLNPFGVTSPALSSFDKSPKAQSDKKAIESVNTLNFGSTAFGVQTAVPNFLHCAKKEDTPLTNVADDDDENIGREEATVILKSESADDNCVFEADKSKLYEFKKDENRWADKGTNALQVLTSKANGAARILIRNQIGTIVLNAALYKGIKITPHQMNGKNTGVLVLLQAENESMTQFLIKVSSDKVDDLIRALEEARPN